MQRRRPTFQSHERRAGNRSRRPERPTSTTGRIGQGAAGDARDGSGRADGGDGGEKAAIGACGGGSGLMPYRRGRLTLILLADETEVRHSLSRDITE